MAEEQTANAPEQQFALQRLYVKDISFEAPMGAEAFRKQWKPQVNQDLNTKTAKIEDDLFEVVLTITVTVKLEDETAFLVEVQQAGLFGIKGLEGQQLAQVLNTVCPNILFPYAREAIDNAVTKGSFPALMLPPVNFDALFAQAVAQAKQKAEAEGATVN
ncbi:MAG: protein-export chaperone SecB [Candidatus Pelagadaptatus aseana]|uniref:protein-export chaperone SecB n=1 Tax=Candidatus Pelagadaptatus aseana TaxID=3120508 RepID=UPI0039B2A7D4